MSTTKVRLWFREETELARKYSKVPPERVHEYPVSKIWIPKSIIEHTSKEPSGLHIVTLPDWFVEKEGL